MLSIFSSITLSAGIYCKYLTSCADACYYYNQGYYRLDRDKDGIPCENLCHSPCNTSTKKEKTNTEIIDYNNIELVYNEKDYQEVFCKKVLGIMEYKLKDGTRVDCYTSTYSFEVDFGYKAYEALGQAMQYSAVVNNKPGIVLILKTSKDKRYANRIKATAKRYGIRIFTIDNNFKIKIVK